MVRVPGAKLLQHRTFFLRFHPSLLKLLLAPHAFFVSATIFSELNLTEISFESFKNAFDLVASDAG